MDAILLVCRLALAAIFVVAAVAKAVNRDGSRRALAQFGVPAPVVPAAVILLPLAELAVAVMLVPVATAGLAALAAVALLAVFTLAIGAAVARGDDAECHCFGNVSSRPVGAGTLARNVGLLALAGVVAVGGAGVSATAWIGDLSTPEAVLVAFNVILAVGLASNGAFLFQLFRQNGRLWAEIEALRGQNGQAPPLGPQIGELAPAFSAPDLSGQLVALDDLLDQLLGEEAGLLLTFTSSDCSACDPLLPEIGRLQRDPGAGPRPVLIALGSVEDVAAKCSEHGIDSALVIDDFDLPRLFGVNGSPGAVVVDSDGRIAGGAVVGRIKVEELMRAGSGVPQLVRVGGTA